VVEKYSPFSAKQPHFVASRVRVLQQYITVQQQATAPHCLRQTHPTDGQYAAQRCLACASQVNTSFCSSELTLWLRLQAQWSTTCGGKANATGIDAWLGGDFDRPHT
jgi:hypothetical protein